MTTLRSSYYGGCRDLLIAQGRGRAVLDADGTLVIARPAETPDDFMASLVQEDIVERLAAALRFAGATLDRLDTGGRITDVAPVAALGRLGYTSWRTRAEAQRERGRMTMNVQNGEELVVVTLRPPSRRRRALTAEATEIAEDLAQLLRQAVTR